MAQAALLVAVALLHVAVWHWRRVQVLGVARQAVVQLLQPVGDLRCEGHERGCRLGPSLRGVTGVARSLQVVLGRAMAVGADVFGHPLSLGVAHVAGGAQVSTDQWYRMQLRRDGRALETGRRVALLAIWPKVGLAWRLVAVDTFIGQTLARRVTRHAVQRCMRSFQRRRVLEAGYHRRLFKPVWRVAVLAIWPEVRCHRWFVAVGALVRGLLYPLVTVVAPHLGVLALQLDGVGEGGV